MSQSDKETLEKINKDRMTIRKIQKTNWDLKLKDYLDTHVNETIREDFRKDFLVSVKQLELLLDRLTNGPSFNAKCQYEPLQRMIDDYIYLTERCIEKLKRTIVLTNNVFYNIIYIWWFKYPNAIIYDLIGQNIIKKLSESIEAMKALEVNHFMRQADIVHNNL